MAEVTLKIYSLTESDLSKLEVAAHSNHTNIFYFSLGVTITCFLNLFGLDSSKGFSITEPFYINLILFVLFVGITIYSLIMDRTGDNFETVKENLRKKVDTYSTTTGLTGNVKQPRFTGTLQSVPSKTT